MPGRRPTDFAPDASSDLVQRLSEAASECLHQEAAAITHDPERLRGVVLELSVDRRGLINEATVYIERHSRPGNRGLW